MEKSRLYKEIYRAIATYDSVNERGLSVSSEGMFPQNIPSHKRKECMIKAAEVAQILQGTTVTTYYDLDKEIVVTHAEDNRPRAQRI